MKSVYTGAGSGGEANGDRIGEPGRALPADGASESRAEPSRAAVCFACFIFTCKLCFSCIYLRLMVPCRIGSAAKSSVSAEAQLSLSPSLPCWSSPRLEGEGAAYPGRGS